LKRWLRSQFAVFTSTVEASHGSTVGVPDLLVTIPGAGTQLPVEVKYGSRKLVNKYGPSQGGWRLVPRLLRPTQIAWHDALQRAGGRSRLVIGHASLVMPRRGEEWGWQVWMLDDCRLEVLKSWKLGLPEEKLIRIATDGVFDHKAWWRGLVPDKA
jgi:hypothetical protein